MTDRTTPDYDLRDHLARGRRLRAEAFADFTSAVGRAIGAAFRTLLRLRRPGAARVAHG